MSELEVHEPSGRSTVHSSALLKWIIRKSRRSLASLTTPDGVMTSPSPETKVSIPAAFQTSVNKLNVCPGQCSSMYSRVYPLI